MLTNNPSRSISPRTKVAALSLSAAALVGIAVHEGYVGEAYPDPAHGWRVPTIGFGETAGVKPGDKTTPTRAMVRLLASAQTHTDGVKRCLGPEAELFQHELDAYASLAYNIGVGGFCRSSIPAAVRAKQYEEACRMILKFNRANGQVLPGLVKRREAESKLCLTGEAAK